MAKRTYGNPRHIKVFALYMFGYKQKQIAKTMGFSASTVSRILKQKHSQALAEKLLERMFKQTVWHVIKDAPHLRMLRNLGDTIQSENCGDDEIIQKAFGVFDLICKHDN